MTASSANSSWRCFLFAFCEQKESKKVGFVSFLLAKIAFIWKNAIKVGKIFSKSL